MTRQPANEAAYLLRRLLVAHGEALEAGFRWVWESERLKELLFALLLECADRPQAEIRALVDDLENLELLDVGALAAAAGRKGGARSTRHGRRLHDYLLDAGFTAGEADRSVTTICEAARTLEAEYGGKVQRYLREQGERMRSDLGKRFSFSELGRAEVDRALTLWLQNALELPLSLLDEDIEAFCREQGVEPSYLVEAADELGINLALLDDLVEHELLVRAVAAAEAEEAADLDLTAEDGP